MTLAELIIQLNNLRADADTEVVAWSDYEMAFSPVTSIEWGPRRNHGTGPRDAIEIRLVTGD